MGDCQVAMEIAEDGVDAERLAELTVWLRQELLTQLPVESVKLGRAEPPPGAKGAGAVVLGQLLITVASSSVLVALVRAVRDWIMRHEHRSVKLRCGESILELTGGVADQTQQRLIQEWIERCGDRPVEA
jgi:hypothetical protein